MTPGPLLLVLAICLSQEQPDVLEVLEAGNLGAGHGWPPGLLVGDLGQVKPLIFMWFMC